MISLSCKRSIQEKNPIKENLFPRTLSQLKIKGKQNDPLIFFKKIIH